MILHVDMDAFYASVELRDQPHLRGLPVVVGGSPQGRGVISAASYEARKFGVYSAMSSAQALRLCPNLVFAKSRMDHYAAISKQIREIFFRFTSLVEPLSLDEAFLDVSGSQRLFGDSITIGKTIQKAIDVELNLPASVGVAPNKYLAKVASDLKKPNGFVVVEPDAVDAFLEDLDIARVWGIGPKTAKKFHALGVRTIGQLKRLPKGTLKQSFGLNADHFWRLSRGLDTRPVVPDRIAKSVSHETTFAQDIETLEPLQAWAIELADQVGRRLRRHNIFGKTIQLKLRFHDFRTITRSATLEQRSQTTQVIADQVKQLLNAAWTAEPMPIRLIGVGVSNLSRDAQQQLHLFDQDEKDKSDRVDSAADAIRDKFGGSAVQRASSLKHGIRHRARPKPEDE
ncbi:MAG: DNA polymerase IV [Planctomycetota bacterium]